MPIFAYRCDSCGFEKDVLQKRSDPPLSTCPDCNRETFSKRLTAPAFQLKGSGWYVTDFRDNGKSKPKQGESGDAASAGGSGSGAATADAKPAPASGGEAAKPAPSPASKPASTPASTGAGGGSSTQAG
jgi:putative FmdB family regulatory protein